MLERGYPDFITSDALVQFEGMHVRANAMYLQEHGLIELKSPKNLPRGQFVAMMRITHRGMDFLADDGGLSAILGVVTVRLHEDSLKAIFLERIDASNEPETVKTELKEQIRKLPAEGMRTIVEEGLKAGLRYVPDFVRLIQSWI